MSNTVVVSFIQIYQISNLLLAVSCKIEIQNIPPVPILLVITIIVLFIVVLFQF